MNPLPRAARVGWRRRLPWRGKGRMFGPFPQSKHPVTPPARRTLAALLVLSFLPAIAAKAQETPPRAAPPRRMTFDDVIALRSVSDAQISPDGKWTAYTVARADLEQNASDADIWLASTLGEFPSRLTTSRKSDSSPRWSPDSRRIAFISAREEKPQIFLMSAFGGEPERLTEHKGGVRQIAWSPDGKSIAFIADQEPTPEEEKRVKEKDDAIVVDTNFRFNRLWVIDVATKKARMLATGDAVANDPQWSPDGTKLAYTTTPTPRADDGSLSDIWVVTVTGGAPRKLVENAAGSDNSPRWSPDGTQIAYVTSPTTDVRQSQLAVIAASGGTPRMVAPQFLYQPGAPAWSPDGRTLYFGASVRTTTQLFAVPSIGGTPRALTDVKGVVAGGTFSRDGKAVVYTIANPQKPADVHVATIGEGLLKSRQLTDHNPQVRDLSLGRAEVVKWKSTDGMDIDGVLLYPVGYEPGKRYPLVAAIHGGPAGAWTEGFPAGWSNPGQVMAGQGFAVFYPNPRGSSAYGEKFLRANIKDWGAGDYRDIQTGIDALVARGIADSTRLAQTGWSYGGYMTAWTLTQTNRFKALVVGAGLTDMFSMYATNDIPRALDGYFGAEPWNDTTEYRKRSAMTYIKNARTPTLILHGQADLRVPIGQAQELYVGLKKNNVPVQLVFYPREPHGLQEPRHQLDKMKRENEWIRKWTLREQTALVP
jgi:dipeptidyl aminopeptidase/acylaminoacyl peptidase